MQGYVTIGTNDKQKALAFYDELLSEFGGKRIMDHERGAIWSIGGFSLGVLEPYDGKPACIGNGCMVGLLCENPEQIQRVYDKAISLGSTCEGPPGQRGGSPFHGGYFRDLDGNKLVAYYIAR